MGKFWQADVVGLISQYIDTSGSILNFLVNEKMNLIFKLYSDLINQSHTLVYNFTFNNKLYYNSNTYSFYEEFSLTLKDINSMHV